MAEPDEATRSLVAHPRFPVERLMELRAFVDALVGSNTGDSPRCEGADDAKIATQAERFVRGSDADDEPSTRDAGEADAVAPDSVGGSGRHRAARHRGRRTHRQGER